MSFLWPADNTRARALAVIPYANGLLIPLWTNPQTWQSNSLTVSPSAAYALASSCGFCGADVDAASGAWLCQYTGSLVHLTSGGGQTNYNLPASAFTGVAFVPSFSGNAYALASSGQVYTNSGSGVIPVGSAIGTPCWGLATSGSSLFTVTPSGLGTFALSASGAGTSGMIATPLSVNLCVAATSGHVAVGGYTAAVFSSGWTDVDFDLVTANLLAMRPANGRVELWNGASEQWAFTQSMSGIPHPTYVAWNGNGAGALVVDPTGSGSVNAITFSLNSISLTQTLPLTGAGPVTIQSDQVTAFVCQALQNRVVQYNLSSGVWASGATFPVTGATSIVSTSVSGAAVGYTSGVAFLQNVAAVWSIAAAVPLTYVPSVIATDSTGNVIAAGSTGATGFVTPFTGTASGATQSWTGSVNGMIVDQGQIVIGDQTNSVFRVYEKVSLPLQFQATSAAPSSITALGFSPLVSNSVGGTLFAMGSGALSYGYQFVGPFTLAAVPSGAISILTSGSFTTTQLSLGIYDVVTALTWDVSGNLRAATRNNFLYTFAPSGTILSSGAIAQYSPQPQTTTLGISDLTWALSHLWGVSSLNGSLMQLI